jgi:hypothetical protein
MYTSKAKSKKTAESRQRAKSEQAALAAITLHDEAALYLLALR